MASRNEETRWIEWECEVRRELDVRRQLTLRSLRWRQIGGKLSKAPGR